MHRCFVILAITLECLMIEAVRRSIMRPGPCLITHWRRSLGKLSSSMPSESSNHHGTIGGQGPYDELIKVLLRGNLGTFFMQPLQLYRHV